MKKLALFGLAILAFGVFAGCSSSQVEESDVKNWQQSEDDKKAEAAGKKVESDQPDR